MTYDKIKSHKKPGIYPLLRRYIFEKTTKEKGKGAGRQINTPSQIFLRVKVYLVDAYA